MSSLKSFLSWLVGGALFAIGVLFVIVALATFSDHQGVSITYFILSALLMFGGHSMVRTSKQVEVKVQVNKNVRASTIERQDQMLITIKNQLERGEIKATDLPPRVLERLIMGDR